MESSNERTNQVLEKWGVDGNLNEIKEEDLQKAAEMYAKIMVKNRSLKRFAFGGIFFVVVFLGLMLASVIIGAEVSKDFKVKDEALVQKSGNVLQTSEMLYHSLNLNLTTPFSVIKGIKSLKFINKQDGSIIQFNVVSFYYIRGRKLTFYGQTHMANVLSSGEVEFFPISKVNGEKRIDETKMKRGDAEDLSALSSEALYGYGITPISDCNDLSNIGSTGKYSLLNNINCNLSSPLLTSGFFGTFNGHGNTITLNMNVDGPAALFSKVGEGAVIANLFINGNIVGKGNCSAFAVEAFKNSLFLGCAVYANVTCSNVNEDLDDFTALGGFAAVLRNPPGTGTGRISFYYSVNQGNFVITSSTSNKTTYTGGSYGRTGWGEVVQTSFNFTYSASLLSKLSSSYRVNRFGFKYAFPSNTTVTNSSRFDDLRAVAKRDDPYIPEDCYNYTGLDFINMCIAWYVIYWYENYDCCSDFNSCPYVMCDHYSDVCYYCQHKKVDSSPEQAHNGIGDLIVPTIKNVCGYFSN